MRVLFMLSPRGFSPLEQDPRHESFNDHLSVNGLADVVANLHRGAHEGKPVTFGVACEKSNETHF